MKEIRGFRGNYAFLSNFYPCTVHFYGLSFPSVEAAFQAAKCANPDDRIKFCELSAKEAKRLGKTVELRSDWEQRKKTIMHNLLVHKFSENPMLAKQLLNTGDAVLIESNQWHDQYWGVCTCTNCFSVPGKNVLGLLLMSIREDLRGTRSAALAAELQKL